MLEESRILLEQETWLGSCELSCGGLKGSSIGDRDRAVQTKEGDQEHKHRGHSTSGGITAAFCLLRSSS